MSEAMHRSDDSSNRGQLLAIAVVGVITAGAFAPGLSGQFVYDDIINLVQNPHYRGLSWSNVGWAFTTFRTGHYQPLSWLSLSVDYQLWGLDPFGYHLTNLLIHVANALLFFWLIDLVLTRFGPSTSRANIRWACVVGSLLFAVHPLRVESVSWVTERRDVLSGFFYLGCLYAYFRAQHGSPQERRLWFRIALVSFFLSLLSKAWGITLPVVLLVLDVYPLRRLTIERQSFRKYRGVLLEKWPFFAGSALFALLAALAQATYAMGMVRDHGVLDRVVQSAYGLGFYVGKTLVPMHLSPLYPLPQDFQPLLPQYLLPALVAVALTIVLFVGRRRFPWALTAWLCFVVIVSPVLGVAQSGHQIAADRYTYLACLPLPVLVAAGLCGLGARRATALTVAGLAVLALTLGTVQQTRVWHDGSTLWNHALELDPDNYYARNNRAGSLRDTGDFEGAIADLDATIAQQPDFAGSYVDRATVFIASGQFDRAVADLNRAVELRYRAIKVFEYRGFALLRQGSFVGAVADFDLILSVQPSNRKASQNRGIAHRELGNLAEAISDFTRLLHYYPSDSVAHLERGLTWLRMGRGDEARADFESVLAGRSASPEVRAVALQQLERLGPRASER